MPDTQEPLQAHWREAAAAARAWPFVEARSLAERLGDRAPDRGYVLFETGYGPSGLPHIGTFGEVVRTTMVRHAFATHTGLATRLFAFSDDLDALRSVPGNVPQREMLAQHLGKPLTRVPDPFGTHESFGAHNNSRLRAFLDAFKFEYEFVSATDCYRSGRFDVALRRVLEEYDRVIEVILPTLGPERQATYSPFLPISAKSGRVLQVPLIARDPDAGTIVYEDEDGEKVETPVTGGACKLQWKVDWAMRWYALGVDYEMAGKDLIDSVKLSSRICRILGGTPPAGFIYELFLDENGEKISKSRGNGLSVEEWLRYAPTESLSWFMYQKPKTAKKLYFGAIPRAVDDYLASLDPYLQQSAAEQLENPVWHIHAGKPPACGSEVGFGLLLNLANVCHAESTGAMWRYVSSYRPGLNPQSAPVLDRLIGFAVTYYRDFVARSLRYRQPSAEERAALEDLAQTLASLPESADAETIQTACYAVGKRHACFADLRAWFRALYQILLGQDEGPRIGSFFAIYGLAESINLINRAAAGQLMNDLGDRTTPAAEGELDVSTIR